ncbi:MAG: NAD-dependent epimerase/dehydratase family protein [Acidobacteriaceae bacterium]|nr:NAD-dependent epimerase/dehydratase family protein [Acidobacteriaceae bacterium]
MARILVTGASGFLGWHVARLLLERGHHVRALCRPSSHIRELDVERVTGDLRDPASLAHAIEGCQQVFHVAADYRLWSKNPQDLYDSNVEGTRHLLAAAAGAGVDRIVYTSTVGCIGIPKDRPGEETTPVSIEDMAGHYKRSKWLAEQVALEKARAGLPVIIVNPTAPIGDHDWKPTPTGKIIVDFLRNKLPAFVDTGLNLVDVRDTALGHLLAAEKGRPGERYILGCENLTLEQILARMAALAGKPAPRTKIPYGIAYAAGVVTTAWADVTGKEPIAPLEAVKMARKKMFASHAKAACDLGFAPGPVDAALERAIDWFRTNGYC